MEQNKKFMARTIRKNFTS